MHILNYSLAYSLQLSEADLFISIKQQKDSEVYGFCYYYCVHKSTMWALYMAL